MAGALGVVSKFVGSSAWAKLTTKGGKTWVIATDYADSVKVGLTCDAEGDGATLIAPVVLLEAMKYANSASLVIERTGDKVSVKMGGSVSTLTPPPATSYPEIDWVKGDEPQIDMEFETLEKIMTRTLPYIGKDVDAPYYGVRVDVKEGAAKGVATDNYRVAVTEVGDKIEVGDKKASSFVMAGTSAKKTMGALAYGEGPCRFVMTKKGYQATRGVVTVLGRKKDKEYPDIISAIPRAVAKAEIEAGALIDAIKRARPYAMDCPEGRQSARVALKFTGSKCHIRASGEAGQTAETLDCKGDAEGDIVLNAEYLLSGLIAPDSVATIGFSDTPSLKPITISFSGEKFLFVVVPIRPLVAARENPRETA